MTIKDCIDIVDSNKPNQYTITDKVRWLSFIDEKIINDVLKTHEGYDGRYDDFTGYSDDKLSVTLIAPSPYDRLYTQYLKMKIDEENGETARYNNSATLFNSYYLEYKKYYNKLHKPLSNSSSECNSNIKTNCKAVTDAELESLKNELSFILKNYFADTISDDKVNDVVTKYMQNNTELFKGKDGKTPVKGFDYFTPEEVKEFQKILDDNFNDLKESELGKKENLITPNNENIVEAINGIFSEVIQLGSFVPSALDGKVDKVEGKGLSEVNYTANDKTLLYRINNQIKALDQNMAYKVDAVPGKTLSSNDYTSEDKALLYETKTQMSGKVDKEFGKGLSTEDYTTEEKEKLSNLDNRVKDIEEKEHITEHLTNFFKEIPEGMLLDDLNSSEYIGCYLARYKGLFLGQQGESPTIIIVSEYYHAGFGEMMICQTRIKGHMSSKTAAPIIQSRVYHELGGWSDWESVFATPQYVTSEIKKSENKPTYLTNFFKELPEGMTIDDLKNVWKHGGCYLLGTTDTFVERSTILYVTGGYYIDESGDVSTTCQIKYSNDGWVYRIEKRILKEGGWSDWQDVFATPQYVNEQIAKIPTGGGGEWTKIGEVTMGGTFEKISSYANGVITFENFVPDTSMSYVISNADGTKNTVFCSFVKTDNEGEYTLKNLDGGVITPTIDITTNFVQNREATKLTILNQNKYERYKVRVSSPLFLSHGLRTTYIFTNFHSFNPSTALPNTSHGAVGYSVIYEAYSYKTSDEESYIKKEITSGKPYTNNEVARTTVDMTTIGNWNLMHNNGLLTIGTHFELWGAN